MMVAGRDFMAEATWYKKREDATNENERGPSQNSSFAARAGDGNKHGKCISRKATQAHVPRHGRTCVMWNYINSLCILDRSLLMSVPLNSLSTSSTSSMFMR